MCQTTNKDRWQCFLNQKTSCNEHSHKGEKEQFDIGTKSLLGNTEESCIEKHTPIAKE